MDLSAYVADLATTYDRTAWLFKKDTKPSDYIGDVPAWPPAGSILCSVLPVTDKLTIEVYGPRVDHMLLLHAAPGAPVSDGMGVALTVGATEPEYTVVSTKPRMTHTYILIEAVDIGSQN